MIGQLGHEPCKGAAALVIIGGSVCLNWGKIAVYGFAEKWNDLIADVVGDDGDAKTWEPIWGTW